MKTIKLTAEDVRNCTWTVTGFEDGYRISIGTGTHPISGVPITVERREFLADEELQALNTEERNVMDTRRWTSGMGSDKGGNMPMVHVARTPLAKWFADVGTKLKTEGRDYQKWWLNRDETKPFRTRSGKI